ncbi:Protein apcdd1 [Branchiostoma belcheri]|nr:Protein apcdd1 [Branchiostoma belcheri]
MRIRLYFPDYTPLSTPARCLCVVNMSERGGQLPNFEASGSFPRQVPDLARQIPDYSTIKSFLKTLHDGSLAKGRSAVIEAWLAAPNALGAEGIALSSRWSGYQATAYLPVSQSPITFQVTNGSVQSLHTEGCMATRIRLPVAVLVVLTATVGAAGPGGTCGRMLKTLVHGASVVAPMPPNITGQWVSSSVTLPPGRPVALGGGSYQSPRRHNLPEHPNTPKDWIPGYCDDGRLLTPFVDPATIPGPAKPISGPNSARRRRDLSPGPADGRQAVQSSRVRDRTLLHADDTDPLGIAIGPYRVNFMDDIHARTEKAWWRLPSDFVTQQKSRYWTAPVHGSLLFRSVTKRHKIGGMSGLELGTQSSESRTLPLRHTTPRLRTIWNPGHNSRKGPARRVFGAFFGTTERDLDGDRRASRRLPAYFWPRAEPARDLTAARPNCKSRSAPYHTPHGSRRATDRAPDGSLTETGRKIRRTLGVMTPAGVYAEDMPNGRRFKCDLSITQLFTARSYTFTENMDFHNYQFFYADQHCASPLYTVTSRGAIILRQVSWLTRGGTEADYWLEDVSVTSHSQEVASYLSARVNATCPGFIASDHQWYNDVPYQVLSRQADRDCAVGLDFVLHELQLLRVEQRQDSRDGHVTEELFLGDIHTDRTQRLLYRPTSYQPPLVNVQLSYSNCSVCKVVQDADDRRPPVLPTRGEYTLRLDGEWVSMRCEVRPEALFLTRHLSFYPANRTWEGWYAHYSDPSCRHATFSIHASGSFTRGARSALVEGGTEYIFQVTHMRVTPEDSDTTSLLNVFHGQGCGNGGTWQIGLEQDVTSTNGCVALGITLPHIEYELFKMERDMQDRLLLYIGQRPSDGTSPKNPAQRPTSYQTPLLQCLPSVDRHTPDIRTNMNDVNISRRCTFNSALVFLACVVLYGLR